jgi:hypothetical protein
MMTRNLIALGLCLAASGAAAAGTHREVSASRTETVSAKVTKVDQETRMVTVVSKDGTETTFKAGEEVQNLKQVKAGDVVTARLDQTLTLWLLDPNEPAPELAVGADVFRTPKGGKPGGSINSDVAGVATVEKIAPDKSFVVLKGPKGNLVKLAVKDPANLEGVTVGTRVGFAYSETLAVNVAAGKAEKKETKEKKK